MDKMILVLIGLIGTRVGFNVATIMSVAASVAIVGNISVFLETAEVKKSN
jgi:hypothetical protein